MRCPGCGKSYLFDPAGDCRKCGFDFDAYYQSQNIVLFPGETSPSQPKQAKDKEYLSICYKILVLLSVVSLGLYCLISFLLIMAMAYGGGGSHPELILIIFAPIVGVSLLIFSKKMRSKTRFKNTAIPHLLLVIQIFPALVLFMVQIFAS